MKTGYLLIPVELCKYAISNHKEQEIFTLILLKKLLGGQGYVTKHLKKELSKIESKSLRSIDRYICYLKQECFINFDKKTGLCFIKSWYRIIEMLEIKFQSGVKCYPAKIRDPQAFFAGAVIGRLVNENRQKYKRNNKVAQNRMARASNTDIRFVYQECSNRAFAKICNISLSSAYRLKRKAFNQGYLVLKRNLKPIVIGGRHISLSKIEKKQFMQIYPEYYQVRIIEGKAYSVDSDLVKSLLKFKRSQNY